MKFSFTVGNRITASCSLAFVHLQRRFAVGLLLLPELDLGLDHIALRDLAEALLLLRDVEKTLRLLCRLLRGRVFAFSRDQAVVAAGDGDGEAARRNLEPRLCQRGAGLGAPERRQHVGRKFPGAPPATSDRG